MKEIDVLSQLADMKDIDYKNTLAITSMVELLIEKGIITRQEMGQKAREIDNMSLQEIRQKVKKVRKEALRTID